MVENKKGIFISTATQIIGRVIGILFALASIKLITNYLGTSGTGEFNTVTTYINFFIVIADLGLFSVTVREIAKDPSKERKIISNVLWIRMVTAFIACLVAGGIVFLTNYDSHIKLGTLIALGFIFFNLLSSVYDIVFQLRLKMQYSALAELISKFVSLIALVLIVRYHGSFYFIVSTATISGIVMLVFKWLFSFRFVRFRGEYDRAISSWIINAAIPLGAVFIVNNLFFKIDTLMLFVIKGAAAVGIYSVAYKVLEVTLFAGSYFASSLKPTFAKNINSDQKSMTDVLNKAFMIMLLISIPIGIVCAVFSKEIIIFLSNKDFVAGAGALIFLGFTLPLIYLDILLGEILIAKDTRRLLIFIAVFMLIFNFTLNLIFIPLYSFIGAAVVTFVSELVLLGINLYYVRKIISFQIDWKSILNIFFISILTVIGGFSLKLLPVNFIILVVFTLGIYAVLALAFDLFSIREARAILKKKQE